MPSHFKVIKSSGTLADAQVPPIQHDGGDMGVEKKSNDMPKEILRKIDRLIKENKTQELEQMLKLFPTSKNYIEARQKDKR